MGVEILVDKDTGYIVHVQEQPCSWGKMEDYDKHVAYYGDDSRWQDVFTIVTVDDLTIEEARAWAEVDEIAEKNSKKRFPPEQFTSLRRIDTVRYDASKKVSTTLKKLENIVEDSVSGKTLKQEKTLP